MVRVLRLKYLWVILQHRGELLWSFRRSGCPLSILLALQTLVSRPFASKRGIVLLCMHLELLNQVQATVSFFFKSLIGTRNSNALLHVVFKVHVRGFVETIQIILSKLAQLFWLHLFGLFTSGTIVKAKADVNVQLRALQIRRENVGCLEVVV